jgi:hypothetical protein
MKIMRCLFIPVFTILLLTSCAFLPGLSPKFSLKVIVEAGDYDRIDTPVSISLEDIEKLPATLQVYEVTENGRVAPASPAQMMSGASPQLWWIMKGTTPEGTERRFVVEERISAAKPGRGIRVHKTTDGHLEIMSGDSKILRYHTAIDPLPEGADPHYKRSGFIHPVWSPSGQVVTDRAQDYLHQLGMWYANFNTRFEGRAPNFWHMKLGDSKVRFKELQESTNGPVFGGFKVHHEQVDLKAPEGEKVVLNETWDVRAWNVGGADAGYWVFDLGITLSCASSSPIKFNEHPWGGMAIRGHPNWFNERCEIVTSEGKTRKEANHTRVRWIDMSGTTDDAWSGMTGMSHPWNLRHPEPVRVNDTIPYYSFTAEFLGDWEIVPGKDHVLNYRYFVHNGKLDAAASERVWSDFAHPPKAYTVERFQ